MGQKFMSCSTLFGQRNPHSGGLLEIRLSRTDFGCYPHSPTKDISHEDPMCPPGQKCTSTSQRTPNSTFCFPGQCFHSDPKMMRGEYWNISERGGKDCRAMSTQASGTARNSFSATSGD